MLRNRMFMTCLLGLAALSGQTFSEAQQAKEGKKKAASVWTDPADPKLPADFKIQGEYVGGIQGGDKLGCQIIALDGGAFQAIITPGGLPGDGWDGKNKILLDGKLEGDGAGFQPATATKSPTGKRKYLAQDPLVFSATSQFPPVGQKDYSASVKGGVLTGKTDDGKSFELKKTERKSPTLGAKAPPGAIILYDGSNSSEWEGGRIDKVTGLLNTDGKDIKSIKKFQDYFVHAEFYLPFKPSGRDQGRGNSGFYQVHHYEVQILDSFGLDGLNNECGGIYTKAAPKVNMCLPPLTWQTYDIEFTNVVLKDGKKKVAPARITAKLNGVLIHDNVAISGPTGGHRSEKLEGTPGPFILQGHGNPLQFKNIWVVEKK